jgi:hypothetical protein
MDVAIVDADGRYRWLLLEQPGPEGPVLARSTLEHRNESACLGEVDALSDASPEAMCAVQQPDGSWRWRLAGPDGYALAESATVFPDARSCGQALLAAQRALRALAGA